MSSELLEHITTTTCQLIEGIIAQRAGRVPGWQEWERKVDLVDLCEFGWVIYFEGSPILRVRVINSTTAHWEIVDASSQ